MASDMNLKKEIIENQALHEHALFFDPVDRDLVFASDEAGRPMGKYVKKHPGVEVKPNGDAVFYYHAPNAKSVQVAGIGGTMGNQRYDMKPCGNGDWTVTISGIGPGFHYHEYYVDGNRACNDLAPLGYGCFRAINFFEMPEIHSDFYLLQDVPHGTIRMDYYESTVTGRTRCCYVYTPPGYESHPEKRYPVLYLQHGGGESETGWIWQGKVNYIMDNLLASGQCKEMIIVMNNGYAESPGYEYDPAIGLLDQVLIKDCIPFIDKKYRTIADRHSRAMAGLSMGGFQTQYAVFHHPEYFASLGIFSAIFIVKDENYDYTPLFADPEEFNRQFDLMFVSAGDREPISVSNAQILSDLRKKGINSVMYVTPGYHEWQVWRYSCCEFLKRVFQ
jgi:enterochelin esterase-like enzyme